MSVHPTVSVILPVYNGDRFLSEAIESILGQTSTDFELLIINDGSTDQSGQICEKYLSTDHRIRLLTNSKPLGKAGDQAKEMGMQHARGRFIAIMDADDVAKPQRLERQTAFLEAHPDVFLCGSWAEYIDQNGTVFRDWKPDTEHGRIVRNLYWKNSIMHPTFFFRNDPSVFPFYETKYTWYNDYYTQLKLIKQGRKLANVPEILLSYRVSGQSSTQSGIKKKVLEYFQIRDEIARYPATRPDLRSRMIVQAQQLAVAGLPEKWLLRFHPVFRKTI
ncbi:glycosyltransferase involved in cell wall biosynthesis [Larkinella arboricola]|uniref:Glycosyltransferase involved in cell wall biosynthesis n=1 Tax=Larkinella arboricola TaxID=643671 RepID=A0A327WXY3_LARAB|nr:glycosyltransferase family 2 protein [Larkinella arboricola]RAJ98157.1 glycosyltransferase involved in cell wall biosynthesis [Larkinella arboricola]